MVRFLKWFGSFFKKFTINGPDRIPYLTRYYILKTKWLKIYLHEFHRSDADRDFHCHPWNFTSIVLSNGYYEYLPNDIIRVCPPGTVIHHKAADAHMVKLFPDPTTGIEKRTWTLVFVGKKYREWGFHTEKGWVHHRDYFDIKFGKGKWQDADEVVGMETEMED